MFGRPMRPIFQLFDHLGIYIVGLVLLLGTGARKVLAEIVKHNTILDFVHVLKNVMSLLKVADQAKYLYCYCGEQS